MCLKKCNLFPVPGNHTKLYLDLFRIEEEVAKWRSSSCGALKRDFASYDLMACYCGSKAQEYDSRQLITKVELGAHNVVTTQFANQTRTDSQCDRRYLRIPIRCRQN